MSGDEWMLPVIGFAAVLFVTAAALASCGPTETVGTYPVTADIVPPETGVDVGVSVDAGRIDFGRLPAQDITAEKTVRITNNDPDVLHATVQASGNITAYLSLSRDTLTVSPGETTELTVTMDLTNTTATGRYSGTVTVIQNPCA